MQTVQPLWAMHSPSSIVTGASLRCRMLRGVKLGGLAYKRVPRGFDADHPRAELLRHGALYVSGEWKLPRAASGPGFVGWVADRLEQMAPVERWLTATLRWET